MRMHLLCLPADTANLAQILVRRARSSTVENIEDAIAREMTICVYSFVLPVVKAKYPTGDFVGTAWLGERRHFYAGKCEAMVVAEYTLEMMHQGTSSIQDSMHILDTTRHQGLLHG